MRWQDYIDVFEPDVHKYAEALRKSIVENNVRATGSDHQNVDGLAPIFSDGTSATFSYRGWGDLMAAVWSEEEDKDYCYMDFYY